MYTLRTSNCEINMVANKHCAWGTCKNDSRYPELWTRNKKGDPVFFLRFPATKRSPKKRNRWIRSCHRGKHGGGDKGHRFWMACRWSLNYAWWLNSCFLARTKSSVLCCLDCRKWYIICCLYRELSSNIHVCVLFSLNSPRTNHFQTSLPVFYFRCWNYR